ncbi:MAG: hypothetical protein OXE50_13545 [Chloroflexi bacterium]|nr:hypothetical protein [Chloroflexota bacterium]
MGELQFAGIAALVSAPVAAIVGGIAVLAYTLGYLSRSGQVRRLQDLRAGSRVGEEERA